MSRVWVTDDTVSVYVEIVQDDVTGNASARCLTGDWATNPDRVDSLEDVANQAGIHVDYQHSGGAR